MGGRGRGGGRLNTSLTQEQLTALGVGGKDMQAVTNAPPPIFPTLASKPLPLDTFGARDYKILWKEDFMSYLKDSAYYTYPSLTENKFERYSDKYIRVLTKAKDRTNADFPWHLMPAELKPNWKRKKQQTGTTKKIKVVNVEEKLKLLEQKEVTNKDPDTKEKDSDEENEDEIENEVDEEMDEDNDYGNSYFDNGDAYNEEDDNLDDGPIY